MAFTDSDFQRLYCISTTGSPPSPGFYTTAQNDGSLSYGANVVPSISAISSDVDQNLFKVFSLDDMSSSTYYATIAILNQTTGSPGSVNLTDARVWFPNIPSASGLTVSAQLVGTSAQASTAGPATPTTAPVGVSFSLCSNHTSYSTGLKAGTGSPKSDRDLLAARANAFYLHLKLTLLNQTTQLLKSLDNNKWSFAISGGDAS